MPSLTNRSSSTEAEKSTIGCPRPTTSHAGVLASSGPLRGCSAPSVVLSRSHSNLADWTHREWSPVCLLPFVLRRSALGKATKAGLGLNLLRFPGLLLSALANTLLLHKGQEDTTIMALSLSQRAIVPSLRCGSAARKCSCSRTGGTW